MTFPWARVLAYTQLRLLILPSLQCRMGPDGSFLACVCMWKLYMFVWNRERKASNTVAEGCLLHKTLLQICCRWVFSKYLLNDTIYLMEFLRFK